MANPCPAPSLSPFIAFLKLSLNTAKPLPFWLLFKVCCSCGSALPPACHGSPYIIKLGSISFLNSVVSSLIVFVSINPIKSNLNPSTSYSLAKYLTESFIYFLTIGLSVPTSLPHPDPLVYLPSSLVL